MRLVGRSELVNLLCLLVVLIGVTTTATALNSSWVYHGAPQLRGSDVASLPDGGYAFAASDAGIVVGRADAFGRLLWSLRYGAAGDYASQVLALEDGRLVVAGSNTSNCANTCPWILILDGQGAVLDSRLYNFGLGANAAWLIRDQRDGYLVSGDGTPMYVMRLRPDLSVDWVRGFNQAGPRALATFGSDRYLVAGIQAIGSGAVPWLGVLSGAGTLLSDCTYTPAASAGLNVTAEAVTETSDCNAAGSACHAALAGTRENPTGSDLWYARVDPISCTVIHHGTMDATMLDIANDIVATPEGGVLIAGTSLSNPVSSTSYRGRAYVVRLGRLGQQLHGQELITSSNQFPHSEMLAIDRYGDGSYIALGNSDDVQVMPAQRGVITMRLDDQPTPALSPGTLSSIGPFLLDSQPLTIGSAGLVLVPLTANPLSGPSASSPASLQDDRYAIGSSPDRFDSIACGDPSAGLLDTAPQYRDFSLTPDWAPFHCRSGEICTITANPQSSFPTPSIEIHGPGCSTFLNSCQSTSCSVTASLDGTYWARINAPGQAIGYELSVSTSGTNGTAPSFRWISRLGLPGQQTPAAVAQADDGSAAFLATTPSSNAGTDLLLQSVTQNGTSLASVRFGLAQPQRAAAIKPIPAGFVIGASTGANAASDFLIMLVDTTGSVLAAQQIGGSQRDELVDLEQVSSGGFVAVGRTRSFGSLADDILVVRLASNLGVAWSRTIGNAGSQVPTDVAATHDGGVLISAIDGSTAVVIRLDGGGQTLWQRRLTIPPFPASRLAVAPTHDGGFALAGTNGTTSWVGRFGSIGETIWMHQLGLPAAASIRTVAEREDGSVIVGGAMTTDGFLLQVDGAGNPSSNSWLRVLTGPQGNTETIEHAIVTHAGGLLAIGRRQGATTGVDLGLYKLDRVGLVNGPNNPVIPGLLSSAWFGSSLVLANVVCSPFIATSVSPTIVTVSPTPITISAPLSLLAFGNP